MSSQPTQTLCLDVTLLWWSWWILCSSQSLWAYKYQFLSLPVTLFLKRGKPWENIPSCLDSLPRSFHTGASETYLSKTQTCKLDVTLHQQLWRAEQCLLCTGGPGKAVAKELHKIGFLCPPGPPKTLPSKEPRFHPLGHVRGPLGSQTEKKESFLYNFFLWLKSQKGI